VAQEELLAILAQPKPDMATDMLAAAKPLEHNHAAGDRL
jgi:hypothetical protein